LQSCDISYGGAMRVVADTGCISASKTKRGSPTVLAAMRSGLHAGAISKKSGAAHATPL
jgi:hypothetical protein